MKIVKKIKSNLIVHKRNNFQKVIKICASLFLYLVCYVSAYAEDILAKPVKSVFDTFVNTGVNVLLLIEIITAGYIFSTKERSIKTWMGLPILILVTAYAKARFGG